MPKSRRWIKLWVVESLEGSIRYQLEAAERCVWYDLLLFSATCSPPGTIADRDGRPYPRQFLASRLNITEELFNQALQKSISEGRVIDQDGVIIIKNWERYQSEYDRQRPYREAKKADIAASTAEDIDMIRRFRSGEITAAEYNSFMVKKQNKSEGEI